MPHPLAPLFNLIQHYSNISLVQGLLKSRGSAFSAASWQALIETRVIPALEAGMITIEDLHVLLRSAEEFGGQHIFLFKCSPQTARPLCTHDHIAEALHAAGLEHLLTHPLALENPERQTLTDVRIDTFDGKSYLVIKTAEPREVWRFRREEVVGEELHRISEKALVRSLNVARLSEDGLLEVRIASRSSASKYAEDLQAFLTIIRVVLDTEPFREHSLYHAKSYITKNAAGIKELLRVSQAKYRDTEGYSITAATGSPTGTIANSARLDTAVGSFNNGEDETYCENTNFWFLKCEGQEYPSRDIHVLLDGETHEFAINSKCMPNDYEYVLGKIAEFNSPVSE